MLSHPLSVVALVSRYLTNKLIEHRSLSKRRSFTRMDMRPPVTIEYYPGFLRVILVFEVSYQCVTLPFAMPVLLPAFDLHALDTSQAFILSQDQTLCSIFSVGVFPTETFLTWSAEQAITRNDHFGIYPNRISACLHKNSFVKVRFLPTRERKNRDTNLGAFVTVSYLRVFNL